MKYKTLLFDLDNTLLDFDKSQAVAIKSIQAFYGVEHITDFFSVYKKTSDGLWQKLENGLIDFDTLAKERFALTMQKFGASVDGGEWHEKYVDFVAENCFVTDGAMEIVNELSKKYDIYIITNGFYKAQQGRLEKCGLDKLVKGHFVSEKMGVRKPDKAYFDLIAQSIDGFDKEKTLVIGDSLTSDIAGGINSGIKTVWYNAKNKSLVNGICPDYTVYSLSEIPTLLESLEAE